jgi:hypothetical protein
MSQKIEFQKIRGIAEIINATFEFTRENLKPLLKAIFLIAGPFILAGSLLFGYIMYVITEMTQAVARGESSFTGGSFYSGLITELLVFAALFLIAFFFFYAAVYEYIDIYIKEKKTDIEISEVWRAIRRDFWLMVKTLLGLILMFFLTMIIFTICSGIVIAVATGIGALTSPIVTVILILPVYILLFYLLCPYSLIFNVRINERKRFFDSVSQCHKLISGNRMSTMGVILLSILVQFMLSFVLNLPKYISDYLHLNSSYVMDLQWLSIITTGLGLIAGFAIGIISIVSINLQYFNLLEKKQAPALLNKIEGLGSAANSTPTGNDETY